MNKIHLHITIILLTLFSYNSYSQNEESNIQYSKNKKIDTIIKYRTDGTKEFEIKTKDGLKTGYGFLFDRNDNIIGLKYYVKDTLNGYNLLLDEKTFTPKYLYESNNGKPKGILIEFHKNGSIKKFRSADTFNDSQILKFHKNGVIKEIGQTKKGKAHGTFLYFDKNGKLEKKVDYEYGNIVK